MRSEPSARLRSSGPLWRMVGLAAALLIAPPVFAQDERPTGYPRSANERPTLGPANDHPQAVSLSAVYTVDIRGDAAGGVARGTRYLDNLDLQMAIDADRLVGWHGTRMFVYAIYDSGVSLSKLVGDVQRVSNIETSTRAAHLFEAWVEQDVGPGASLKAGLYNLNSEFDTTHSGGLFLVSSHGIGPDFSQSGRNGPSIFPVTSLGLRGEFRFAPHWLLRAAVLDGVPGDPVHPKRTVIRLSEADGALVVGEVNYLRRGTKAAIGVWGYTARFDDLLPSPGASTGHGDKGAYVFAEQRLIGERSDDAQGLAGWLRFGVAETRFNAVGSYLGGGVVYTGIFAGRDDDQAGVSFASANFGDRFRAAQTIAGKPTGPREVVVEAAYNAIVTPWLSFQPDVQYVIDPGGDERLHDAVVVGVRLKLGR